MATYFHGNSEIQADGLQTLILMNPGYVNYSDTQQQQHQQQQQQQQQHQHHHQQQQHQHQPNNNFVFLNSAAAAGYSLAPPHPSHNQPQQPHTQQFVGIPLPPSAVPTAASASASQDQNNHEISALHGFIPRVQYNLWNQIDPSAAAREIPRSQQGLSLSLSSHQQQPAFGSFRNEQRELPAQTQQQQQQQHTQAISPTSGGEEIRVSGGSPSSASGISNGVSGIQSVLLSSKYLKAAQILLDEVVNVVDNGIKPSTDAGKKSTSSGQSKTLIGESSATGEGSDIGGETKRSGAELTTAERQEIQMKKAKLISMLDEVEQRYRQYHLQMQIVISSFEQAAGIGSAKTYTALALQTISKQFRCLKDAILGQIRASNKSLGEEDSFGGGKMEGGSRLKFVDHQLRQQRALQQLGMIQHNAWRPQRGLPERSVSVLRAWLFEHFLHPYPKDSDKHMLAKQTGLTRSQVSNWFINARVRLWKPMVEEMYLEEIKEQEQNGSEDNNNNNNNTSKSEQNDDSASKSTAGGQEKGSAIDHQKSFKSKQDNHTISTSMAANSPLGENLGNHSGFMTLIGSSELEGITVTHGSSPKKQRGAEMLQNCINMDIKPNCETNNEQISMKFGIERQDRDGYSMMGGGPANFIGGFGSYPIAEIGGRFDAEQYHQPRFSSNAVSLTLGLPDNENLSLSGTHQSFYPSQNIQLGRRLDIDESNEFGAINTPTPPHSSGAYDNMNIQNRKRFAAQLLPDFVA